jgi:hypothetical protein
LNSGFLIFFTDRKTESPKTPMKISKNTIYTASDMKKNVLLMAMVGGSSDIG